MKRAILTAASVLFVFQVTASVRADDKAVRKELEAAYAKLAKADQKSDGKAYCALLTPDFKHKYRAGKWESPESITNMFSMRGKGFPDRTLKYTIGNLDLKDNRAVATITERIFWDFPAAGGGQDKIEKVTKLRSTWIKTKAGWHLQLDEELDNSQYFKNGKPERD